MTEVCKTDNFVAKCYDNPDNETYPVMRSYMGKSEKLDLPLYNIIKIHKLPVSVNDDKVICSFKECRTGPSTPFRTFIKINGVQWFIGSLNFRIRYFINCDTGVGTVGTEELETWYNIKSMSPNGTLALIYTYVYAGNTEYIRLYDLSQLDTVGPIIRQIEKLPTIFDDSNPELFTLDLVSDTEVSAKYKFDYEDEEWRDMGIYKIK
jgi:hypothetical protein